MAGVFKRKSDKARKDAGKWTIWWRDASGKRQSRVASTDRARSLREAQQLEADAQLERAGLLDPADAARRNHAARPIDAHLDDWHAALLASGNTARHAKEFPAAARRLLAEAALTSIADLAPDRVRLALGRRKAIRSARNTNYELGAVMGFVRWLELMDRIAVVPKGLKAIRPFNVKADRRHVRRALTPDELARLIAAAEGATDACACPGPERAMLYVVAAASGLRANELRSLTVESFRLQGDAPSILLRAESSKRRREDCQPIRRDVAAKLRPWLAAKPPGSPVFTMPKHTARMIRRDLEAAGIAYRDGQGRVVDFHAIRATFVTHLVLSGANIKIVQKLARHSTPVLTLNHYTLIDDNETRKALEDSEG